MNKQDLGRIPAVAATAESDPVFEAIETYRATVRAYGVLEREYMDLDDAFDHDHESEFDAWRAGEGPCPDFGNTPEAIAAKARLEDAGDLSRGALFDVLMAEPTLAGALAVLECATDPHFLDISLFQETAFGYALSMPPDHALGAAAHSFLPRIVAALKRLTTPEVF